MIQPSRREPVRLASLAYQKEMARQDEAANNEHLSITLGFPVTELAGQVDTYAKVVHEKQGKFTNPQRYGYLPEKCFAQGQIGAELWAAQWGLAPHRLTRSDDGFDVFFPTTPPLVVEVRTRLGFLTVEVEYFRHDVNYYALVQQRDVRSPFIFCGVITPAAWERIWFPFECTSQGVRKTLVAVNAADLHPATQFYPFQK